MLALLLLGCWMFVWNYAFLCFFSGMVHRVLPKPREKHLPSRHGPHGGGSGFPGVLVAFGGRGAPWIVGEGLTGWLSGSKGRFVRER